MLPLHNLLHICGAKILLRNIAKAVSHMACFDRFLFLTVWPSLQIPFLKTAGRNQGKGIAESKQVHSVATGDCLCATSFLWMWIFWVSLQTIFFFLRTYSHLELQFANIPQRKIQWWKSWFMFHDFGHIPLLLWNI